MSSRYSPGNFRLILTYGVVVINVVIVVAQVPAARSATWAARATMGSLENCYLVDEGYYRSEQPSKSDMKIVEQEGIKTLVNLRSIRKDNRKSRGTGLHLVHVPVNTWKMSYDDIVKAMKAIMAVEKPVLLHCIHGSDRTGVVTAAYRMVEQGWTKEAAIDEFLNGGYGYHRGWFPNILRLLEDLDVEKLKADLR